MRLKISVSKDSLFQLDKENQGKLARRLTEELSAVSSMPEESVYIEAAYNHYGFFRCKDIPADRLVRVGKLLIHGRV